MEKEQERQLAMRILGIDYGDSRIGVAVSDPLGWTAGGLETISAKNRFHAAVEEVAALCKAYEVQEVVVGYPRHMNGTCGERTQRTEGFIEALLEKCKGLNLEIIRWDERLTSAAAHRTMQETGASTRKQGKGLVDRIAAQLILQGYLDSRIKLGNKE